MPAQASFHTDLNKDLIVLAVVTADEQRPVLVHP